MPSDEDDVVVRRRFERDDGDLLLVIHKPRPDPQPEIDADPDDPPWKCRYTIHFPGGETRHHAMGIDSRQAMLFAVAAAQRDIRKPRDGAEAERPATRFLGKDDLGLHIPQFD